MLEIICKEINNFFVADSDRYIGEYSVVDGQVVPSISIQEGQYYRIVGSAFNEGVYIRGQEVLRDEKQFHGAIWLMRPPKAFLQLVQDIEAYEEKYGEILLSPYTSENFAGYGYTKPTGGSNGSGGGGWQSAFASRLKMYRRMKEYY